MPFLLDASYGRIGIDIHLGLRNKRILVINLKIFATQTQKITKTGTSHVFRKEIQSEVKVGVNYIEQMGSALYCICSIGYIIFTFLELVY